MQMPCVENSAGGPLASPHFTPRWGPILIAYFFIGQGSATSFEKKTAEFLLRG